MNREIGIFISNVFSKEEKEKYKFDKLKKELKDNICSFCHRPQATLPIKKVTPSTLLLRGFFYNEGLCEDCVFTLKYDLLRKKNYIIEAGREFKTFKHTEIWDNVLTKKIKPPSFISLTTSYKKHNIFFSEINYTSSHIRHLVFNQQEVIYSLQNDIKYFDIVYTLYNDYKQTKIAIETGNLITAYLDNKEFGEVKRLYNQISHLKGSIFLKLLTTYVLKPFKKVVIANGCRAKSN